MKSQFRIVLDGLERTASQELNNPIDIEEEWRKKEFPQICSKECKHTQCGYHNPDHYGQACEMQWKPKETEGKPLPHSVPSTSYSEGYTLAQQIEKAVKKAFKPIDDRLKAIENAPDLHVQRSFNSTPKETIPVGYPTLFKELQRRNNYAD